MRARQLGKILGFLQGGKRSGMEGPGKGLFQSKQRSIPASELFGSTKVVVGRKCAKE